MTSRDPQMCCEPQSTFGGHVTSQCKAVWSAILATAWLLVSLGSSFCIWCWVARIPKNWSK